MFLVHIIILLVLAMPVWAAEDEPTDSSDTQNSEQGSSEQESDNPASSESSSREPLNYVTPNKAKQRMAEVVRHLKTFQRGNEIIEINGKDGPMAGLYLPENTGKPQGGILILHDIDQHAHWPNTISPVREYLPDYGWNTLSIFFDQYIEKPLPKIPPLSATQDDLNQDEQPSEDQEASSEADSQQAADTNENPIEDNPIDEQTAQDENTEDIPAGDALDAIANNIDEVPEFVPPINQAVLEQPAIPIEETFLEDMIFNVEQGLSKLNELGQYNLVIIANGFSANWAAKLLEQRLSANSLGYALILIDAKSSEYPEVDLNASLAKLNIPMLDIVTDDSDENKYRIKQRKGAMLRKQNSKYMQLYLPAVKPDLTQTNNIISRRIRGWLLTHAAGEEVSVKQKGNY
ncbi:MAG: hypothetical protein CL679_10260 [Bermanella sp.]|nr:hypothetical protein [Bermanella sp.]